MPSGYTWSATEHKWTKKKTHRELLYEQFDGESWALILSVWRWYPDYLLDVLLTDDADFATTLLQRIFLRIFARYKDAFITGCRGTTKSYSANTSRYLDGVLWPGEKARYFGPALNQTAEIASATRKQIQKNYPLLMNHWSVKSDSKDSFECVTSYGSEFSITAMRGDNASSVLAEEVGQEEIPQFDHQTYRNKVLPAVRLQHHVDREPDPLHIDFKQQYITSACRQQNDAFGVRCGILNRMRAGEDNCFAIDIPWQVPVLLGIRDISWADSLREQLTPEEWMREMESIYTGVTENPVLRDSVLTESQKNQVMELHHCHDPQAIYIIGYDVSYEDGAKNAKCATSVMKLTQQKEYIKRNRYLKQMVYVSDMPPRSAMHQALYLKALWRDYTMDGGEATYIAIDGWQYGKAVVEYLMQDLGDGCPPFSCMTGAYASLEQEGALPVIYPIKATAGVVGEHDPDSEMLRYAELEFEGGNVWMLTKNINDGVKAYKAYHRIKDSDEDGKFAIPYAKCKELCGQIGNLKRKLSGGKWVEVRISKSIQRDMWSATKYALRLAQILEQKNLADSAKVKSSWADIIRGTAKKRPYTQHSIRGRTVGRRGGKLY